MSSVNSTQEVKSMETEIDPVCGMKVSQHTKLVHEYNGKKYCFCAPGCRFLFKQDPEKYLKEGPVGMM